MMGTVHENYRISFFDIGIQGVWKRFINKKKE